MSSTRTGNWIAVVGFTLLSVLQFIVYIWLAKSLNVQEDSIGAYAFFLFIPTGFALAFIPVLRRIGADFALAAATSAFAFFAVARVIINVMLAAVDEAQVLGRTLQLLGPVAGFLSVILLLKAFHKVTQSPFVLIPASVLTVWLVDQAVQAILELTFAISFMTIG